MVKPGYKQTEIGVIPEDWEAMQIGSFARICMCKRVFADQTAEVGDIPFYKIGTFGGKPDAYISRALYSDYKSKYSYPEKGDVLISAAGTLGRTVVFDGADSYFQDSNIVWLDIDKAQICNEYLKHYYEVIQWAASEGSTISRLYNGIIESTFVSVPPLAEQQRIAAALSDMDELIASLEKLIAKKKAIKQGAMQELLTGKRRLPGFGGEWRETPIKSIGEVITGSTPSRSRPEYWDGKHAWVSARDFNFKYIANTAETVSDTGKKECRFVPKGSILVTCIASIGLNAIAACECATNQQINSIICNPDYDNEFVYYQIGAQTSVMKAIAGQTAVPIVSKKQFEDLRIAVPPSLQEQQEIGRTLANIDFELLSFRKQLTKVREIKQGMMQQLLTGKIRLQSEV